MRVDLFDAEPSRPAAAAAEIVARLQRAHERDASAPPPSVAKNIIPRESLGEWLANADAIIEAVVESAEVKISLFAKTEPLMNDGAMLASNTSSCSISELAKKLRAPHRFVGIHFMNPPPRMPLVEVIPGEKTNAETLHRAEEFARALGKETVRSKDAPGFLTNRMLLPMINEAIYALHSGTGAREDIDRAMILGMRHPMGPLALADFIGLDTCLAILQIMHRGFKDDKFAPCPLLQKMVAEGRLGRKSGAGFYDYPAKQ